MVTMNNNSMGGTDYSPVICRTSSAKLSLDLSSPDASLGRERGACISAVNFSAAQGLSLQVFSAPGGPRGTRDAPNHPSGGCGEF